MLQGDLKLNYLVLANIIDSTTEQLSAFTNALDIQGCKCCQTTLGVYAKYSTAELIITL